MTEESISDSEDKTIEIAQSEKRKKNQSGSGKELVRGHSDGCGCPLHARY